MKISRERLIEELAHYIVEVRELREENMSLRKELESFSEERIVIETRESEEEELERLLDNSGMTIRGTKEVDGFGKSWVPTKNK